MQFVRQMGLYPFCQYSQGQLRQENKGRPVACSPSPPPTAHAAAVVDHCEIARLVAAQLASQFQANVAAPALPASGPPAPNVGSATGDLPNSEDTFMEASEW